jgi:hypothetical protein
MKDKLIITEEDLFRFVLHPDKLSEEKQKYIGEHQTDFKSEIEHYKYFLEPISEIDSAELNKIIEEIFFSGSKIIGLTPTINSSKQETVVLKLAAASATLEKQVKSISFADPDSKYLVRIVVNESDSLMYIFPVEGIRFPIKITFYPSRTEYIVHTSEEPISIFNESIIDKITIEEPSK